ncbi:DivIVA domain-containing protein [Streptomyces piniterrae]|uniref:DivIVA domain-containing protein n=1 Tax=Streptomyces piniterrae TaxID=2571125 RepID=A0A4U0MW15_9ACTN|nr:DivIVA domain-containing protein [Streptomyces piniterrae]TJZ45265.1 DivIVA domain-containing protein [Streptomyces piniterrae]
MFWFLLIAMVVVVAAVTLVVVGGGDVDGGGLRDSPPDRLHDPLPGDRPLVRADVDAVRFPLGVRGYRMVEVDDVLDRLGAELAERDSRIAELEAALAGAHAAAMGAPGLIQDTRPGPAPVADGRIATSGEPESGPSGGTWAAPGPVDDVRPHAPGGPEATDRPESEGSA